MFDYLKILELGGEVSDIKCQQHIRLTRANIVYIADFSAIETKTGQLVYYEFKGYETEMWLLKKRLYRHYGPAPLRIFVQGYNGPRFKEEIIPDLGTS